MPWDDPSPTGHGHTYMNETAAADPIVEFRGGG